MTDGHWFLVFLLTFSARLHGLSVSKTSSSCQMTTAQEKTICADAEECRTNCPVNCTAFDATEVYNLREISFQRQQGTISNLTGLTPYVGSSFYACQPNMKRELPQIKVGSHLFFSRSNCENKCTFDCKPAALTHDLEAQLIAHDLRRVQFFECGRLQFWWYTAAVSSGSFLGGLLLGVIVTALSCRFCSPCRRRSKAKEFVDETNKRTPVRVLKLDAQIQPGPQAKKAQEHFRNAPLARLADEEDLSKSSAFPDSKPRNRDEDQTDRPSQTPHVPFSAEPVE